MRLYSRLEKQEGDHLRFLSNSRTICASLVIGADDAVIDQ